MVVNTHFGIDHNTNLLNRPVFREYFLDLMLCCMLAQSENTKATAFLWIFLMIAQKKTKHMKISKQLPHGQYIQYSHIFGVVNHRDRHILSLGYPNASVHFWKQNVDIFS